MFVFASSYASQTIPPLPTSPPISTEGTPNRPSLTAHCGSVLKTLFAQIYRVHLHFRYERIKASTITQRKCIEYFGFFFVGNTFGRLVLWVSWLLTIPLTVSRSFATRILWLADPPCSIDMVNNLPAFFCGYFFGFGVIQQPLCTPVDYWLLTCYQFT
jgi:hypothetical protein